MSLKHRQARKQDYLIFDHLMPPSPHLKDFNERIILSNKKIQTNKLKNTLELVKNINIYHNEVIKII